MPGDLPPAIFSPWSNSFQFQAGALPTCCRGIAQFWDHPFSQYVTPHETLPPPATFKLSRLKPLLLLLALFGPDGLAKRGLLVGVKRTSIQSAPASEIDPKVPDDRIVTEANRAGRPMVWPHYFNGNAVIRCFMPGLPKDSMIERSPESLSSAPPLSACGRSTALAAMHSCHPGERTLSG